MYKNVFTMASVRLLFFNSGLSSLSHHNQQHWSRIEYVGDLPGKLIYLTVKMHPDEPESTMSMDKTHFLSMDYQ